MDSAASLLDSETLRATHHSGAKTRSSGLSATALRNLADIRTLRATPELSSRQGFVPRNWEQEFEAFGQTAEYRAMLEQFEPLTVRFERGASRTGLVELLEKNVEAKAGKVAMTYTFNMLTVARLRCVSDA